MKMRSDLPSWKALEAHYHASKEIRIKTRFDSDIERFSKFSIEAAGLFLDYSKNRISEETLDLLAVLAEETGLVEQIADMFQGSKINCTEKRAVLHTALRNQSGQPVFVDGEDVMASINAEQCKVRRFVESLHAGDWQGFSGKKITDVVNIGIGGSDLGPKMVVNALSSQQTKGVKVHFVSNIDGEALTQQLSQISPETTLFVVVSKTFTTQETMTNAKSAKKWLLNFFSDESAIADHFVAVSSNMAAVKAFGIKADNRFKMWDWVGGRFSLWSSAGLSIALAVGMDAFEAMLKGAYQMDRHFSEAPLLKNMPVILALVGIWNRNFQQAGSYAVLPYDHRLSYFASYLQQCDMESNGKSVDREGRPVSIDTGPIVWGEVGTDGQHAFYQSIHQGTQLIPADFIGVLRPDNDLEDHHRLLISNCFAQAEALMKGKRDEVVRSDLKEGGVTDEKELNCMAGHKAFKGDSPSNMILMERLLPETLGALIALYEHKITAQGMIWGINSFDQWGVELGKELAREIVEELDGGYKKQHDSSTEGLLARYRATLK